MKVEIDKNKYMHIYIYTIYILDMVAPRRAEHLSGLVQGWGGGVGLAGGGPCILYTVLSLSLYIYIQIC